MSAMCLDCELFNCVDCDSYAAIPEYGCCCGSIQPDEDVYSDDDERARYDDGEVANGG